MFTEKEIKAPNGIMFIFVLLAMQLASVAIIINGLANSSATQAVFGIALAITVFICWFGFFMVNPKEARVLQLFGKYTGTVHASGLRWANPFYTKARVSMRVRNFESGKLKVNDKNGKDRKSVV